MNLKTIDFIDQLTNKSTLSGGREVVSTCPNLLFGSHDLIFFLMDIGYEL